MRAAWIVLALAAAGCQSPSGETIIKYDRGGVPQLVRVSADGEYQLIDKEAASNSREEVWLRRGEQLGFRQDVTGLKAVAGAREVSIGDEPHVWKRK